MDQDVAAAENGNLARRVSCVPTSSVHVVWSCLRDVGLFQCQSNSGSLKGPAVFSDRFRAGLAITIYDICSN